ncbi:MAG: polysaccharide pyruvyl transferase family protein [Butyrivibrio sp.]|jgi:hypothetical protein|nr:polysaccharide pyruvyl transferase family protein [Butyrivibrio sp.]
MKKIALLSFIKSYNYGASLQAYALWHIIINRMGSSVDCKYINYRRDYKRDLLLWFTRKVSRKIRLLDDTPSYTIKEFIKETISLKKNNDYYSNELKMKFESFWNLTPYTKQVTKKELRKLCDEYDIFMVGSDQVWNPGKVNLDTSFLLDFVRADKKKFSYASSFGMKKIPNKYENIYKKYLNRFDAISVREKAGLELLSGILEEEGMAEYQCDPTMLLDKETWNSVTNDTEIGLKDYVLIYDLTNKDSICKQVASLIAKQKGLDTVVVSQKYGYGPKDWVQLFLNAKFIVTNSFHGTAFSINFSKDFISLVPDDDFFENSVDRISGLLAEFNLEDRIIREKRLVEMRADDMKSVISNVNPIDYSIVQCKLAKMRENGINYLKECLK